MFGWSFCDIWNIWRCPKGYPKLSIFVGSKTMVLNPSSGDLLGIPMTMENPHVSRSKRTFSIHQPATSLASEASLLWFTATLAQHLLQGWKVLHHCTKKSPLPPGWREFMRILEAKAAQIPEHQNSSAQLNPSYWHPNFHDQPTRRFGCLRIITLQLLSDAAHDLETCHLARRPTFVGAGKIQCYLSSVLCNQVWSLCLWAFLAVETIWEPYGIL